MGSCDNFRDVISRLSEKFYCLAVDLPGHGQTHVIGADECYTMPNTAQALIDLLDELKIKRCFLAGYSMGARLGLYMTLHFPGQFKKVILESASPGLKTAEERSRRREIDERRARELETTDFKDFLLTWYQQPIFKALQNHPQFERLIESRLRNNPLELAKSLRYMGTGNQPSLWEKLSENNIPILLLVGEYDDKFKSINAEIARLSGVAQLEIIPNTSHTIHFENMTKWVTMVIQFCSQ